MQTVSLKRRVIWTMICISSSWMFAIAIAFYVPDVFFPDYPISDTVKYTVHLAVFVVHLTFMIRSIKLLPDPGVVHQLMMQHMQHMQGQQPAAAA